MANRRPPRRRKRKPSSVGLADELISLANQNRFDDVLLRFEKDAVSAATSATCLHVLGVAQTKLQQYDTAIQSLRMASEKVEVSTNSTLLLAILGDLSKAYYCAGRFAESADILTELADNHPAQVELARNLVLVLEKANRVDEAISRCVAATERWPQDAQSQFLLGDLKLTTKAWRSAAAQFSTCLEIDPNHDGARRRLVTAYRNLGDQVMVKQTLQNWLDHDPENEVVKHLVAAQNAAGSVPTRASDGYVREVFDQFAETFESQLLALGYSAPAELAALIKEFEIPSTAELTVLDAGCGTGLMAEHLRPIAGRLIGVDLSQGMLDRAAERPNHQRYDELICVDLVTYLQDHRDSFDMIMSADTFNYFGELQNVFRAAWESLRSADASLMFSLEQHIDANSDDFRLNPSGRYSHDVQYVRRSLQRTGFNQITVHEGPLRTEAGQQVTGLYWGARKCD